MLSKCKRIYQLGLKKSACIVSHRVRHWYFAHYWQKNLHKAVHKKSIDFNSVSYFLNISSLCPKTMHASCIDEAEKIMNGTFVIFGSSHQVRATMPWHQDITGEKKDSCFSPHDFYTKIVIAGSKTAELSKDIKVPWELSRLQQLPILGHAYALTKNDRYAHKIIALILDWIAQNPFLHGVNWCNAMEVGLRAVNWIIALSMIKDCKTVNTADIASIIESLRNHLIFIEGNWEWYDGKTSNHYLSDLVGYLYLAYFFNDRAKKQWAIAELERELYKQVLPDGTSYEGSTAYHRLVTELFYYAQYVVDQENGSFSESFIKKYAQMTNFLWWCTPYNGSLITVGDNDSGSVTAFLLVNKQQITKQESIYFKDFGLSIYKSKKLHVSLRHHAYHSDQPTGHFHNDVGSITMAIDSLPIFVDPGSYVYTASSYWRNHFRSVAMHNTTYIDQVEPVLLTERLFYLGIEPSLSVQKDELFLMHQAQYARYGAYLQRAVQILDRAVVIRDNWQIAEEKKSLVLQWNFTVHPDIVLEQQKDGILLWYYERCIAQILSSTMHFKIFDSFYSPSYGQKEITKCIRATLPFATIKTEIIILV